MTPVITAIVCIVIVFGVFLYFVVRAEYSLYREEQKKAEYLANWDRYRGQRVVEKTFWQKFSVWWCWWWDACGGAIYGLLHAMFRFLEVTLEFFSSLFKEMSFWHLDDKPYNSTQSAHGSSLYKSQNTGNKTVENAAAAREVYNRTISDKRMRNTRSLAEIAKEIREDQIIREFEGLTAEELKQFDAERDADDRTTDVARKEFFNDMPWDNVP